MSQSDKPVPNITSMPADGETAPVVEEKRPNVLIRAARKIKKTPPKTAAAIVGGVVLVAAGAAMGRKTAPLYLEVVDSETDVPPMLVTPSNDDADDTVA